jgi:peroxiredoxin
MALLESLSPVAITRPDGSSEALSGLIVGRNTVLVFIRHFGCIFCREQVLRFKERLPDISGRGYDVLVIGQGAPEAARAFVEAAAAPFPVVVDPSLEAFRRAGLRRSIVGTLLDPRAWVRALGAIKHGRPGRLLGDPWQNGGVFVLDRAGHERFRHISRYAGDHPRLEAVLSAMS